MSSRLTIDRAGRIVLPKPVRDRLQLAPGDELDLETLDDRITLRPSRGSAQLKKRHGVWVFRSGEPLSERTVRDTLEQVRRERTDQVLGKK